MIERYWKEISLLWTCFSPTAFEDFDSVWFLQVLKGQEILACFFFFFRKCIRMIISKQILKSKTTKFAERRAFYAHFRFTSLSIGAIMAGCIEKVPLSDEVMAVEDVCFISRGNACPYGSRSEHRGLHIRWLAEDWWQGLLRLCWLRRCFEKPNTWSSPWLGKWFQDGAPTSQAKREPCRSCFSSRRIMK